ncbi:MAG: NAD-dependent epimerase/dehydratase family protein [Chitinophagaceae bacterium]|nr:MAG: NAD-dependent epimerase/dehydratase family protein [Chitinophagaceae bacterium]
MEQKQSSSLPEVWGGIECTINRVGDRYRDQLISSGHYRRGDDIAAFAELGIRALRYPILWEKHQSQQDAVIDFSWSQNRLNEIRSNNIEPIAGLLHHGSGPAFTSLEDPGFPEKLAEYAGKVAEQFPWIRYYTPVNEPLTTARFSGLYGFWYPHRATERSFFLMLLNQLKGTVLAMQAIRAVNPEAQLVQTEDLSYVHSTQKLAYQASFENKRRWLTMDLLCGLVDRKHYFWKYIVNTGIDESELDFFLENKFPPSIIGYNYYVTSERYLDENLDAYPVSTHGGNGKHFYADFEAVRKGKSAGLKSLLQQAWDRYGLPLAVTECHLSCTREEQLRWFTENWKICCELRNEGVDLRAITAWSLLGAYDWNSLLTRENQFYEPGVFDVSNNHRRPTALVQMIQQLATRGAYDSHLLNAKGWWHNQVKQDINQLPFSMSPVMIIGKTGTLGSAFQRICEVRSLSYVSLTRQDIDILDEQSIRQAVERYKPWAIVNATGFVRVDEAEQKQDECFNVNAVAPSIMAKVANDYGISFVSFSSDLVFDGDKNAPYTEDDLALPLNIYGESKARGESMILEANDAALVVRTSAFFGPWDKYNFVYAVLNAVKNGQSMEIPDDVLVSPTYVPDLCHAAMDLLIDQEKGIWHISNSGITSWAEFGGIIAAKAGYSTSTLIAKPSAEMCWKARRPLYSVLESGKGIKLPLLEDALHRYFENRIV